MRDRYPSVINLGTHPLTISSQNIRKSVFWYVTTVLKKYKKAREPARDHRFFVRNIHENCQVF
jgi:hypothetical protein